MKGMLRISLIVSLLWGICIGVLPQAAAEDATIIFAAYTVPKDAYEQAVIPAFIKYWKEKTGQTVQFEQSYEASGAQSRTIASGLEADIAALSLEKDISRLKDAGLITHDWKQNKYQGIVTNSLVVIVYRPGNPKNIKDWDDLKRPDVDVLYPSPKTSGGAMWDVNAIYGSGLKHSEVKTGQKDYSAAKALLKGVQKRVKVMDKSGRASVTTFEQGIGDALVTYEDEALLRKKQGKDFPFIIPESTILIENPIAVIDKNVDKHNTRQIAEAFVEFVHGKDCQKLFAEYGLRPVNQEAAQEFKGKFPVPKYLFDTNYLGGWDSVQESIYGKNGVWTKIIEELATER